MSAQNALGLEPWQLNLTTNTLVVIGFDPATRAWVNSVFGRSGVAVTATQAGYVDTLITGLKTDGIWTKLDRMWLFAIENSTEALIDIVTSTAATVVGAPTFTANRGYTGVDQASPTAYLNSNYITSVNGVQYTQNSAHLSIWSVTNTASVNGGACIGVDDGVTSNGIYDTYIDGNCYFRCNDAPQSGAAGVPPSMTGHFIANRTGASASQGYRNGALFASPNQTSGALVASFMAVLAQNSSGGVALGTPQQIAMASLGAGLTGTDATNLYNRLRTYMTAVGVP